MTIVGTRSDFERMLATALSRHIGYTTGAYGLTRILSILDFFGDKPSAYKQELLPHLRPRESDTGGEAHAGDSYLAEITNFAQAMRIVETVSSKDANLQRLAPTELGRSVLGAKATGDTHFYRYFISKVAMLADADFLVPVLKYYSINPPEKIQEFFANFQDDLRRRRKDWLIEAIPERFLLDRIVDQISWLSPPKGKVGEYRIDIPTKNTARHHATPRQGWLHELGMLDRSTRSLTPFGEDVLLALDQDQGYFWLAPPAGVQDALRIEPSKQAKGPAEDSLNYSRGYAAPSEEETAALIEDLSRVMISGFPGAKLIHAPQASLLLPIEYINYRSYIDQRRYSWEQTLDILFHARRSQLERFSAHKGRVGFYRPRDA